MADSTHFEVLAELIRQRKTTKVFGLPDQPLQLDVAVTRQHDLQVQAAIEAAGPAPFHFARNLPGVAEPWLSGIGEPWRVTTLWWEACRTLATELPTLWPQLKAGNKLPAILSACGAAVLVHWLPATSEEISDSAKREETNFEHLAAASAYIQNLLLLLTAAGLESYWATANLLDTPTVKARLGIPETQKLLGAIMVGYPLEETRDLERAGGGNHGKRSPVAAWSRSLVRLD